jgi:hypothetical protein
MVYIAPIGSKDESESLFQNLAIDIIELQTLRGIILGGDFNVRTTPLLDSIDNNNFCELLEALIPSSHYSYLVIPPEQTMVKFKWGHCPDVFTLCRCIYPTSLVERMCFVVWRAFC